MQKDFDKWNEEKKRADASEIAWDFFFHEREVWWCAIGANVGVEIDGKHHSFERPVLIIRKFNKEMFLGVPLTSNEHDAQYHIKITHEHGSSWAVLSQLRTWSSKRLLRRIGKASEGDFTAIVSKLNGLIKIETPR